MYVYILKKLFEEIDMRTYRSKAISTSCVYNFWKIRWQLNQHAYSQCNVVGNLLARGATRLVKWSTLNNRAISANTWAGICLHKRQM